MRRLAALRRELRPPPQALTSRRAPHAHRQFSSAAAPAAAEGHSDYDCTLVPNAWDFDTDGGAYPLSQADDARAFFAKQGFVVFTDAMSASENAAAIAALVRVSIDVPLMLPTFIGFLLTLVELQVDDLHEV